MIWSIETEDYRGVSGVTSPLLGAIKSTYVSVSTISKLRFQISDIGKCYVPKKYFVSCFSKEELALLMHSLK